MTGSNQKQPEGKVPATVEFRPVFPGQRAPEGEVTSGS